MVNSITIVGRVGRDAELKSTQSGTAVATFTVATSERFSKDGQRQEITTWHRVTCWRKLAEVAGEYVMKGTIVYIRGLMKYREYEDKDGTKRTVAEIVAQELQLLGGGKPKDRQEEAGFVPEDEDVPL